MDGVSGNDNPWHFGANDQYPALRVDFNGDGTVSDLLEFGRQRPPGVPAGLAVRRDTDEMDRDILVVTWSQPLSGSAPTSYQYRYSSKRRHELGTRLRH